MKTFFKIRYEFDRETIHKTIAKQLQFDAADYISVADGVILNIANRNDEYLNVINGGMFAICDSSYVPLYIKWIYGERYQQYSGSQIFRDIITSRKYRMAFLGGEQRVLDGLKCELGLMNPAVRNMLFYELPFCKVDEFDYPAIAEMINNDGADIIWIALGAPKQELFMHRLKPYLKHGVIIAVGAAFKFFSGMEVNRAPEWMVKNHLEFVHRLWKEPKKQGRRCYWIIKTLPSLLFSEWNRKRKGDEENNKLNPMGKIS